MNHKELEAALDKFKQNQENIEPDEVFGLLHGHIMAVPAVMPKNTSPEIMKKMLQNPGKSHVIPEGANPQPCILESTNGEKFLPVFTSEEEMRKGKNAPNFPLTLNLPFESCIELFQQLDGLSGVAINAYTHNFVFHGNKETLKEKKTEVTIEEYHYILRQRLESFLLPKQLFEKKEEFVTKLCNEKGECIRELYDQLYDGEIACPYTADDFEFMILNISEDLLLGQISMPKKNRTNLSCSSVIYAWDKKQKKIWYYAIVLGVQNESAHLFEVHEDGKNTDLGEAPAEGSELSKVMELIQGA